MLPTSQWQRTHILPKLQSVLLLTSQRKPVDRNVFLFTRLRCQLQFVTTMATKFPRLKPNGLSICTILVVKVSIKKYWDGKRLKNCSSSRMGKNTIRPHFYSVWSFPGLFRCYYPSMLKVATSNNSMFKFEMFFTIYWSFKIKQI